MGEGQRRVNTEADEGMDKFNKIKASGITSKHDGVCENGDGEESVSLPLTRLRV